MAKDSRDCRTDNLDIKYSLETAPTPAAEYLDPNQILKTPQGTRTGVVRRFSVEEGTLCAADV